MNANDRPVLITISGPPASGTTTLTEKLADNLGLEIVSGGKIFRKMAADRGMPLAEFTEIAEETDTIDKELDNKLKSVIDAHLEGQRESDHNGLVVDSRLAGWLANGRADLSVWLDAPSDVRAKRISNRTETAEELRTRAQSDASRYQSYYGIDINDLSIYDLVIDTDTLSEEGMFQTVNAALSDVCKS